MRTLFVVIFCGLISVNLFPQDKRIDAIRNDFNSIEQSISQKKLIEIRVDSNANAFQCEGVQYKISFWKNLYTTHPPVKVSTFTSDSQIAYKTDYYYGESGACFFIFQEKNDLNNSVIEQYRVYIKDGAIAQVVYTYKPDSAEKSTKTFTVLSGEMKTMVQNLLRLAGDFMNYTRSVENVPR